MATAERESKDRDEGGFRDIATYHTGDRESERERARIRVKEELNEGLVSVELSVSTEGELSRHQISEKRACGKKVCTTTSPCVVFRVTPYTISAFR